MPNEITFDDTMQYEAPEEPDCLVVPEIQWDKIIANLKKASALKDNILWAFTGILGGGSITSLLSYVAFIYNSNTSLEFTIIKYLYLGLGIILLVLMIICFILAIKFSSSNTANEVLNQMNVLKLGFKKLVKKERDTITSIG
jgi:hypothetical protein